MRFWDRIRIYVLIWLGIGIALACVAVARYKDALYELFANGMTEAFASIFTIAIMIYAIVSMIRGVFR